MLIKLENGDIVNTNRIELIRKNKLYFSATDSSISVTDKDIENIMLSQQQFFVLPDYEIEDIGGIFTTFCLQKKNIRQ